MKDSDHRRHTARPDHFLQLLHIGDIAVVQVKDADHRRQTGARPYHFHQLINVGDVTAVLVAVVVMDQFVEPLILAVPIFFPPQQR